MTFSIFERYDAAVKLWEFVSPNILVPPRETLVYWLSKYTNEQFEKAVLRIPGRFRNREFIEPESAYRIVTAELRDMNMRKVNIRGGKTGEGKTAARVRLISALSPQGIPIVETTPEELERFDVTFKGDRNSAAEILAHLAEMRKAAQHG